MLTGQGGALGRECGDVVTVKLHGAQIIQLLLRRLEFLRHLGGGERLVVVEVVEVVVVVRGEVRSKGKGE